MYRPKPPLTIYLLMLVITLGLIALGIAAFTAFSKVSSPLQAGFSAALIEIGAIVEAVAFIRGRNWFAFVGLVISFLVSVTYNYIQASVVGVAHGITGWWQLGTLAVGPLSALTVLSMTLGREYQNYEKALADYEKAREERRRVSIETERAEQLRLEMAERQERLDAERIRLEAEVRKEQVRAEQERKAAVSVARLESKASYPALSAQERKVSGNLPTDWRNLPEEDRQLISTMRTTEIAEKYGVSERTARNWRTNAMVGTNGNGQSH